MKCLIVVAGKSASGKDTLVNKVCKELGIPKILSTTTRPPRKGEQCGVDYRFVNDAEMNYYKENNLLCNMISYNVAGGDIWTYGYLKQDIEKHDVAICIATPEGVEQLNKLYEGKCVNILIEADILTRIERSFSRDDINQKTAMEIIRRLRADEQDFERFESILTINNTIDGYDRFKKYVEIILEYSGRTLERK